MAWKGKFSWGGLLDKINGEKADYEDDYEDGYEYASTESGDDAEPRHVPAVSPVQQTKAYRMIIVEPYSFQDSSKVADHLMQYHPVLINLEKTEEEIGRRLMDFVDGVVYAQHGSLEQVNEFIYLAVPNNMTVDKEDYTYTKATAGFAADGNATSGFSAELPKWQDRT